MTIRSMRKWGLQQQHDLRTMGHFCGWLDKKFENDMNPFLVGNVSVGSTSGSTTTTGLFPKELADADTSLELIGDAFDKLAASKNKQRIKGYAAQIEVEVGVMMDIINAYVKAKTKK